MPEGSYQPPQGERPSDPPVLDYADLRGHKRDRGLVTVASFWDPWEANLALGKLQAEGIPAMLADQNIVSAGGGLYANMAGGIKLQVPVGDAERARAALPKRSAPTPVKCPKCESTQTRATAQHWVVRILFILMFGIPYVLFGKRWACADCGNVWRRSLYEEPDVEDDGDPESDEVGPGEAEKEVEEPDARDQTRSG